MVTESADNTDVQVARYSLLHDITFGNWIGIPVELGGRGGVVQMWGIHHYIDGNHGGASVHAIWASALSSNPDHEGELALGLDDYFGSPAMYGTHVYSESQLYTPSGGASTIRHLTAVIPLYGIIRPRRQIWVQYFVTFAGSNRSGIEIYYSEIDATRRQEAQVNYKYGKYRRGR